MISPEQSLPVSFSPYGLCRCRVYGAFQSSIHPNPSVSRNVGGEWSNRRHPAQEHLGRNQDVRNVANRLLRPDRCRALNFTVFYANMTVSRTARTRRHLGPDHHDRAEVCEKFDFLEAIFLGVNKSLSSSVAPADRSQNGGWPTAHIHALTAEGEGESAQPAESILSPKFPAQNDRLHGLLLPTARSGRTRVSN